MRRRAAIKRKVILDPKYLDESVAKFVNQVMKNGKKSKAETIVYSALQHLEAYVKRQKAKKDEGDDSSGDGGQQGSGSTGNVALDAFKRVLEKVGPLVEVKSRRVGGATYQVPIDVPLERRESLARRWIIAAARKRSKNGMASSLGDEFVDAYSGRGEAVKKREDTLRMANANKAFAHYKY
jgi:small subunit ribosomal protein S7